MLVTPLSALTGHRVAQHGGLPEPDALRLSQLRSSTVGLFPEIIQQGDEEAVPPIWTTALVGQPTTHLVRDAAVRARVLRPSVDAAIDQCHTDLDSLCRRVAMIISSRPITRTRIAFVGDDDLATVALLQIAAPEHLLLLDIDERIITTAETTAIETGQRERLSAERVDLSSADAAQVAARYGETFDVVVTDPPYATDGMLQFVHVAMALTAYTGEVHIAVPALLAEAWTDELLLNVQSLLVASGFVIDRVVPGAFTYETSDVVSSLIIARRLPGGPPISPICATSIDRFYTTRVVPTQEGLLPAHHEEGYQ
ncbi:MAG: bis-aminopropyl spermidine synthase family protein [Pseudonocardiaceae bacterium]